MAAVELIFDIVLAGLLLAVLVGGFLVNRRLAALRAGQAELAALIDRLNGATDHAHEAIADLKIQASEREDDLRKQMAKARALADELTLITEAGDNLANRLEQRLTGAASGRPATPDNDDDGNEPDHDILQALKEAR